MRGVLVVVLIAACGGGSERECTDGQTRPCYSGLAPTQDIGACHSGLETCSGGMWPGVCLGDVTPFIERCNGIDDDCNGDIDDTESAGDTCTGSNGCPGARACAGTELTCVAPPENECGLCGGPSVSGLGGECNNGVCPGTLVCGSDGASTTCDAPQLNECELCGGPAVPNLGNVCMASSGCAGRLACTTAGTTSFCDCSANICNDSGTIRAIVAPEPGDLVITEVLPSPSKVSDAAGEWFEIKVLRDFDLNNLGLDRAGDTSNPELIRVYDCMRVTAGSYVIFAKETTGNGGLPTVAATFSFALVPGPGDVQIVSGSTVIDAITWAASRSGKALQLDPDVTDSVSNDDPANFCDATATYGLGDFGTPALPNSQCPTPPPPGQCDDAGTFRAIVSPAVGNLVITEVMVNPKIEPGEEWFEVTNTGAAAFDLNGLALDRAGDTRAPDVIASPLCKSLPPGAFAVFARSTTAGPPVVDATFGFTLVNTSGDVRVVDPAATTIFDSVTWSSSTDGVSSQVKPGMFTTTANDTAANYCPAITPYGNATNLGTPRSANVCM